MYAYEAIQNSLDFIECHLKDSLNAEDIAAETGLSVYYFQHLFSRLIKKTLNEYIKLRRLAKASEILKDKEIRIIDVAVEYGFSDHANFTRAFREAYGITPEEYRSFPVVLNHFIKPDLTLDYMDTEENVPLIVDGIVIELLRKKLDEPLYFIGVEGKVPYAELSEGDLTGVASAGIIWEEFHSIKSNISFLNPSGNECAIVRMRGKGLCTYIAGGETSSEIKASDLSSFSLSLGEYIVCCLEAENFEEMIGSAIFKAYSFIGKWIKKHGFTCGDFSAEMYYSQQTEPCRMEIWIPLKEQSQEKLKEKMWDKTDGLTEPSMSTVSMYINNPLFDRLCRHIENEYQIKPAFEYSRCSLQYGWNIKYKKSGRALCTIYPMKGYFTVLIVITSREQQEIEIILPVFTEYTQKLYHETKVGMGQRWLMIDVTEENTMEDIKRFISVRRKSSIKLKKHEN